MLSIKKRIIIFIILAIIIILAIFFINKKKESVSLPASGGKYREGIISQPEFNNPLLQDSGSDLAISQLVFSRLIKKGYNLEPNLDLVAKYKINPDATYTFYLYQNALWHDGKPVTVDDVIFTIDLAKKIKNNSSFNSLDVSKIDNYTFKISYPGNSDKLFSLLDIPILPKHIWENIPENDLNNLNLNIKPIGSGPFIFENIEFDKNKEKVKNYTLRKNDIFYRKPPYLEKIIFTFYPDIESAMKGLKQQEIQGLGFLFKGIDIPPEISYNHQIYKLETPQYVAAFFNLNNEKLTKSIRQSLNSLVDKKSLPPVLKGMGFPISGPLLNNYLNEPLDSFSNEPPPSNGLSKTSLELTLTIGEEPVFQEIATFLKRCWENEGIKVNIEIEGPEKIAAITRNGDFEILLYGVLAGLPSQQYAFWHSNFKEDRINLTGFSNRRVDELLELASLANEQDKKYEYLKEAESLIVKEYPAIFLYSPYYIYILRDNIKGVEINKTLLTPEERFDNIENWYIKTKF